MDMLVKGSVVSSTKAQYVSGMKTIAKFLRVQRGCPDVDLESCTEEEFLQFLLSRKKDDFVDPETFRSALLWYHRRAGVQNSFCEKRAIIKAVKGATNKQRSVDKGVLLMDQVDELVEDLENGKMGSFGCSSCSKWTETNLLDGMVGAIELLASALLRPGTLKEATENHLYEMDGTHWLRVQTDKVTQKPKDVQLTEAVYQRLEEKYKSPGGYLFPKCVHKHIGEALERAAAAHGWDTGLVISPMCLRHTAHQELEKKALVVAREMVHAMGGSSPRVQGAHYCKPVAKRRRAAM